VTYDPVGSKLNIKHYRFRLELNCDPGVMILGSGLHERR